MEEIVGGVCRVVRQAVVPGGLVYGRGTGARPRVLAARQAVHVVFVLSVYLPQRRSPAFPLTIRPPRSAQLSADILHYTTACKHLDAGGAGRVVYTPSNRAGAFIRHRIAGKGRTAC